MIIPRKIIFITIAIAPLALAAAFLPSLTIVLLAVITLFLAAAIIDLLLCLKYRKKIKVNVPEVSHASQLREGDIKFVLENVLESKILIENFSHCLHPLFKADPAPAAFALPPGSRYQLTVPCTPQRRGVFEYAPCLFEAVSPLGLWSMRGKVVLDGEIRVYPDLFSEQKKLAGIFLQRGKIGAHIMRFAGQGRDFERLREYVPGDSYDSIAWKATARRAAPVTKVYQVENTQNVYAIVDASRFSTIEKDSRSNFDYYLASALTLGSAAIRFGDSFGVVVFDSKIRSFVPAMGGETSEKACRNAVFSVQPRDVPPDYNMLFSFIRNRIPRRSLIFFLTDISNAVPAEEFIRDVEMVGSKHLCMVNMLNHEGIEPLFKRHLGDADEMYRSLAGHLKYSELSNRALELQRYGVGFNASEKDRLSIDLVNSYLQVKRRQLL